MTHSAADDPRSAHHPAMRAYAAALAVDARGQRLLDFRTVAMLTAAAPDPSPCPLALVVAVHRGTLLLGLNRWRREWELPAAVIEPGEGPRAAAARELAQETGVTVAPTALRFAGIASYLLLRPTRRALAAVYTVELDAEAAAHPSDEFTEVRWADPADPPEPFSILDVTLARAVGAAER